jgi:hypothetical protein
MLQVSTKDSLRKRNDLGRAENKNLSHLVGQPEDFEEEVQISKAGDNRLLSRVDEANHRVKSCPSRGRTFLTHHTVMF